MDNSKLPVVWGALGPVVSGAVFGAAWWFWVDAVVCSAAAVPFLHYLPGFFASFAALMFNCVKREDINDNYYSPYDDSEWSWFFGPRCSYRYKPICMDWHCWCPTDCVCANKWVDVLDLSF